MRKFFQPIKFFITCLTANLVSLAGISTSENDQFLISTNKSIANELSADNVDNQLEPFILMCIVYTISTLSSIVSNLIVILVYVFGHSVKTDLSIFLVNLAIADFLM